MHGIPGSLPTVTLLQQTGIGTAEIAARTCYNSFDKSEHGCIKHFDTKQSAYIEEMNKISHSDLLDGLAWTYFHHSILEHAHLTYLIKGTSRGVLQEHARHRIQAISVRSTRYTMSPLINAFVAEQIHNPENTEPSDWFYTTLMDMDLFVTSENSYNAGQIRDIWWKLRYQWNVLGEKKFLLLAATKDGRSEFDDYEAHDDHISLFKKLQSLPQKRNVGDAFKHIVNDNWKVDMVVTFNLRSLKNYFDLRDSGAAYFQIRRLAEQMKLVTPDKYLDLIVKKPKKG